MARLQYGATIADFLFIVDPDTSDMEQAASGTIITFYDALTGGNQYGPAPSPDDGTGLTDASGAPAGSVTIDANGYIPPFYGPDIDATNVTRLAADASGGAGPRFWIAPNDPVAQVAAAKGAAAAAQASVALLSAEVDALNAQAPVYNYYNAGTSSYPPRPDVGAPVWWVGPVAPAFGGTAAQDGLDFWIGPAS
jgi:hypothetical protein